MNNRDQQIIYKIMAEIDVANGFICDMSYDEFEDRLLVKKDGCRRSFLVATA